MPQWPSTISRPKIIGRSKNRSAVASASYRAGEELHDERLGRSFKFQRSERVAHTEIIAPASAPEWVSDRSKLWNSVEANERRKDAQLSREFEVALPHELPIRLQKELLSNWVREQITPLGLVADVAIHKKPIGEEQNDHAHVMTTFRSIEEDGSWSKTKDRSLNSKEQLEQWRSSWAKHCNAALERAGYDEKHWIDHRSNKARGIETLPTIHEGYAAQGIEARGDRSWRAAVNREIHRQNRQILDEIKARVTQAANAAKRAATAIADGFQQLGRGPGETAPKSKPTPAPAPTWQPPPMRKPDKLEGEPPPVVTDAEAEKRKKAAQRAAWEQSGGDGGIRG
jgi:ATP-dependent exoDNAse (exonuclease V) alpha subunit